MRLSKLAVLVGLVAVSGCGKSSTPFRSQSGVGSGGGTEAAAGATGGSAAANTTGNGGGSAGTSEMAGEAEPIPCPEPAADWVPPEERWPDCVHPEVVAECDDGWCKIAAGCFIMGSPEHEWGRALYQEDQVAVTLTRNFEIGQYEVTQREWTEKGLINPSGTVPDGRGDCLEPACPVGNVTWFEAAAFANLVSEERGLDPCYALHDCINEPGQPGDWGMVCNNVTATTPTVYECEGYRLPTDAEWEYAARAGTRTAFYSGDITCYEERGCHADPMLEGVAWYCHNAGGSTHDVGQLDPNDWGLYDMSGNVAEWNNDRFDGLGARASIDPGGMVSGIAENHRGGGIFSTQTMCRSASQLTFTWDYRSPGLGFRLARTLPPP